MPSRKKDRGKQRRETRKAKLGCPEIDDLDLTPQVAQMYRELKSEGFRIEQGKNGSAILIHPSARPGADPKEYTNRDMLNDDQRQKLAYNYVHNYAQELREGGFEAASVLGSNLLDPHLGPHLRDELFKADVHQSLLSLLNQCDKPLSDVLQKECGVGESVKIPPLWMHILRLMVQYDGCPAPDDTLLEVAMGIEQLVEGIADVSRELFHSNGIWHMCLSSFFEICNGIMRLSSGGSSALLSYGSFLPFVAQASCWSVSRKDIVAGARFFQQPEEFHKNICHGAQTIICAVIESRGESVPDPLEQIARTPLSNVVPNCRDSTIVGFLALMDFSHQDSGFLRKNIIEPLLLTRSYVDVRVIAGVMEIGRGDSPVNAALFLLDLICPILGLDPDYEHVQRSDSRYAAAICSGLLEIPIRALVSSNDNDIAGVFHGIAEAIYVMAGHSKTSRALRGRKAEILEALEMLRKCPSDQFNDIYTTIEDAVDYGASICCNCLKTFDRKDLLFCKRCNVECYCSTACQSESWDAGHSHFCEGLAEHAESEGTKLKRCEVLRQNLMMNGCRFVQRNIDKILGLLAEKEKKRMTVAVNFADHPPSIRLLYRTRAQCSDGLECVFISPVLYGFATRNGEKNVLRLSKVIPQRWVTAPLEESK